MLSILQPELYGNKNVLVVVENITVHCALVSAMTVNV
jgi:hypothetical protein